MLDTNVMLHDATSLKSFLGVTVIIPFGVLEELDKFKKETGELGRNARESIRTLDEFRSKGSLLRGVEVRSDEGVFLVKVITAPADAESICVDTVDNQNIVIAQNLAKQGVRATLVTKDINARVKADALGLGTEDYLRETVSLETFYKGWLALPVSAQDVKQATLESLSGMITDELLPNQFVALQSDRNPWNARLFRFLGGKRFKEVSQPQLMGGFRARNIEQLMALDLLLDDDVNLVSLIGPAGTGKTFLALLAGLQKVAEERIYRKFLISRPIVALGADVYARRTIRTFEDPVVSASCFVCGRSH